MSSLVLTEEVPTLIIVEPDEVDRYLLRHLGFGIKSCTPALEAGHARAALATDNSAASQFGSDFYFGAIEQLRHELGRRGFEARRYRGLELARRTDNRVQVTTCMATEGAGEVFGRPKPKNPKGSSSKKAIHNNKGTLGMLDQDVRWDPIATWWLLYQVHGLDHAQSITAEVSLPHDMKSPRDFRWNVRLILPRIELNESDLARALPEPARPVEVPIVRRVG